MFGDRFSKRVLGKMMGSGVRARIEPRPDRDPSRIEPESGKTPVGTPLPEAGAREDRPTTTPTPAYYGRRKKRGNEICQILLRHGAVTPEHVRAGLRLQEERGGQIGQILVAMGACTDEDVSAALLEQLRLRDAGPGASLRSRPTSTSQAARDNPALAGLSVQCRPGLTSAILLSTDVLAIGLAMAFSFAFYWARASATGLEGLYLMVPQALVCLGGLAVLGLHGPLSSSVPDELRASTGACTLSLLGVGAVAVFGDQASRAWTLLALGVFWALACLCIPLARAAVRARFAHRPWWGHPVVVLGAAKTGRLVVRTLLDQPYLGLKPVMMLDDDERKHGTLRASFTNEVVEVRSRSTAAIDLLSSATLRAARELFEAEAKAKGRVARRAERPSSPGRARGMFAEVEGVPVVGDLALAPVLAQRLGIRYAIVAMPGVDATRLLRMVDRVGGVFSHLLIIPDLFGFGGVGVPSKDVGGVLGLEVRQQLLLPGPRLAKRVLDVVLTALGLVALVPVFALLALLIKLDSPGPVLYFQKRLGRGGRHFSAAKFRTMYGDGEARLAVVLEADPALRAEYEQFHKLSRDPRVTRIGRFLRKYSLDELPQLWNVVVGDMSLVGPRPYLEREIQDMDQKEGIILRTVPGLTGMWQVSDRNATTFEARVKMDVYYVRNWSPWLDLYILARTVSVVLRGTGV